MAKTFTLRVDLESDKGIRNGLPKLLDLLKKHGIKASFYLVMGGESNIFEIMKYRGKLKSAAERSIKIWTIKDKIRMALFPRDFVMENMNILRRILEEGHELGLHGWKHREWARGLNKINIERRIAMSVNKYEKVFGRKPISWASPGFNVNDDVLRVMEEKGVRFISDFPGEKPEFYGKIKNVPITINGKDRMPVIEYFVSIGKSEEEILETVKNEIKDKELASFYIHDLFEARFKLKLLEKIFEHVKKNKIKIMRVKDF